MQQPSLSPRDQELLDLGLFYINQAHNKGDLTLEEWKRISAEWARRILEDDEVVGGAYSPDYLDS